MAALVRHGVLATVSRAASVTWGRRGGARAAWGGRSAAGGGLAAAGKRRLDGKQPPRVESTAQAIAARGFLRPQNSYTPPSDMESKLDGIFQKILGTTDLATPVGDLTQKFHLCSTCAEEFDHTIPNSLLHTIETLNDVKNFYQTPVDTVTPLDKMRNVELPENLHVQFDYHRFQPETDTMFKGQTAFNRSSTLVTGLKYKGKYKGHVQNQQWPFNS